MAVGLRHRLGALAERDFRLLFAGTTITTFGDALGGIALAFAVLDLPGGSATDLGIVIATRQVADAAVLLAGGVLSDRLPRNLVLVGAALVQGAAQAATAGLVLTGEATVALLVALQALYGIGHGLIVPAEVGLVPQTVTPERLQQANALQGLSRNLVFALGPAVGGVLVVAGSPGVALAADAASFFLCAALLQRIRVPRRPAGERPGFWHELREGWREFSSRTWLWGTVALFGIGNLVWVGCVSVLGPAIAKAELGGAGAWAVILSAGGVGAIAGSLVAIRLRPSRPLFVSCLAPAPIVLALAGLAVPAPTWVLAGLNFLVGGGIAIHLALWFTVFQQQIPEHAQSRVSSYDALGSFVLIPLGMALVGPVAAAIGTESTIWAAAAINAVCLAVIAVMPSVRAIRPGVPEPAPT
jgi:predicted MFS family arabinose efflux permease